MTCFTCKGAILEQLKPHDTVLDNCVIIIADRMA